MIRLQEIPLLGLMTFTLIYATIGDPNSDIWSGAYFFVNYITTYILFYGHKSKVIRMIGMALSVAIIIYVASKYFLGLSWERYYNAVTFLICLVGIIKLERRNG